MEKKRVVLAVLVIIGLLLLMLRFPLKEKAPAVEMPQEVISEAMPEEEPSAVQQPEENLTPTQPEKRLVIQIVSLRVVPKVAVVKPGTLVVWLNKDTVVHKIITQDRSYIGKRILPGESDSSVFNIEGEYEYIDAAFPKVLRGKIIVTENPDSISAVTGAAIFSFEYFLSGIFGQ